MQSSRAHASYAGALRPAPAAWLAGILTAALAVPLAAVGPARADSAPDDPSNPATPETVTADALPTVQINGVGLTQVVIGGTVYVGGSFTTARPAGAAPGTKTVARANLLAYDLASGKLRTKFHPRFNDTVRALAVSPDGKRLYVGGSFTKVNGKVHKRIVALNPTTGARLTSFRAGADRAVRAIAANASSVWFGGDFRMVRGASRTGLAKVRARDGAILGWKPRATGGQVTAMVLNSKRGSIVVGGRFTAVNGSSKPGYGLVKLDMRSGKLQGLPANQVVRNGGSTAGITSLVSDGTNFYGSGWAYGYKGGNLEGAFAARWSDGGLVWVASCHGDTYSVFAATRVIYTVGHAHNCANIGGFPDSDPRSYHYAVAFSKARTGVNAAEPLGSKYHSFTNRPAPSLLTWFPLFDTGNKTAQPGQAGWSVVGRNGYVAVAGEFRNVNNSPQQGLVRFVTKDRAPNAQKPRLRPGFERPAVTRNGNEVTISWDTTWDRDNQNLTYQVFRRKLRVEAEFTPVSPAVTRVSNFWDPQPMSYTDQVSSTGEYRYEVHATDPLGRTQKSYVTDPPVEVS